MMSTHFEAEKPLSPKMSMEKHLLKDFKTVSIQVRIESPIEFLFVSLGSL